ncbi:TIGR01212 family radical SAM protein [Candidatus Pseudoruminococcus sp.]|uniref:TIGR01212 family radical SAM protein n=1 Tax=Candidatus Pseudoruminococcus sp. TaxID=3101048 RepID=UPI00399C1FF6
MEKMFWGGRRYRSLDYMLKERYGEKLYKLSLNGGMTCPNRDGKISKGGCIFCSAGGSGDFAANFNTDIAKQIEQAKTLVSKKYQGDRFIAYFQAYTNTYAPVEYLRKLFINTIMRDDIAILSIATRPDCLGDDVIELLSELNRIKPVWVELGLQTINESTAKLINRGYELSCYDEAVRKLRNIGVEIITHMIIGLPHETKEDILSTAKYIGKTADGIKLQLMHILKNTKLLEMYENGEFKALTEEEYIEIVCEIISVLPEKMVIHRLTGDGNPDELIAPLWSLRKMPVLNAINHRLKELDIIQGIKS